MNLWVLLIGIVAIAFMSRYNLMASIRYDGLIVPKSKMEIKDKRILVLDHQPDLFLNNQLGVPFYEWSLYKPVVEQPYYYEHAFIIHRAFEKELPDVIVDPKNLMERVFTYLPGLRVKYEKSPEGYRLIID